MDDLKNVGESSYSPARRNGSKGPILGVYDDDDDNDDFINNLHVPLPAAFVHANSA